MPTHWSIVIWIGGFHCSGSDLNPICCWRKTGDCRPSWPAPLTRSIILPGCGCLPAAWEITLEAAWDLLIPAALQQLKLTETDPHCYMLALEDWIDLLLRQKKYPKHQDLVILQRDLDPSFTPGDSPGVSIRKMTEGDLPDVEMIDEACFEALWVYSLPTLQLAFQQSGFAYLAKFGETRWIPARYLIRANGSPGGNRRPFREQTAACCLTLWRGFSGILGK